MAGNHRVSLNSAALKIAIGQSGMTHAQIAAASRQSKGGRSISAKTVSRLVSLSKGEMESLRAVCRAIGRDEAEFLYEHKVLVEKAAPFLGRWKSYVIEPDLSGRPDLITEDIHITLGKYGLEGVARVQIGAEERVEYYEDLRIDHDILSGRTWVEDWLMPDGVGCFQVRPLEGANLLDGYAIWADGMTKRVERSRNLWVRKAEKFEYFDKRACRVMERELRALGA